MELDASLEYWLRVVLDEEVTVDGCDPKAMPLIEGKLIAKCTGAYFHSTCARFTKEINDPFQERCAKARFLMGWLYGNAHQLISACIKWLDYTGADYNSIT